MKDSKPTANLFDQFPDSFPQELMDRLVDSPSLHIDRIVSNGCPSPEGFWYDQAESEWVVLLRGTAALRFDDGRAIPLAAGDYLLIPPHDRHRVEKVSKDAIWLAVHFTDQTAG